MTWEETIQEIRKKPEFQDLVRLAYFEADLDLNVQRFAESEEFEETLGLIRQYQPKAKTLVDIGSGNGISAVNFARKGYEVISIEPDKSDTVGAGAIRILKDKHALDNLTVYNAFAEDIELPDNSFDIVYVRQAMHHANDLLRFINECVRILKPGGLLLTVRDHVVFDEKDKQWFLKTHPLQSYYGGENAFSAEEYKMAMTAAGASVEKEFKYYDSIINYFPTTALEVEKLVALGNNKLKSKMKKRIGILANFPFLIPLYKWFKKIDRNTMLDERSIPGRMYSYVAIKR
ncbi:MAG: class I SAM-dependent methyltransferase [Bacteroidota bacterium]